MKHALLRIVTLFALLNTNFAIGQIKGYLTYTKVIKDNFLPSARNENYIVYLNGSRSMEVNLMLNTPLIPIVTEEPGLSAGVVQSKGGKAYFLIKDFKAKTLIQGANVHSKYFLVEDTLSNFVWTITKDKKKILEYTCSKATTSFRGRNYEAWFTEEVPVKNGPWKFCGLPGLIVKVGDTDGVYTFNLVSLNLESADELSLEIPEKYSNDKRVSHREFINRYHKAVEDLAAQSSSYTDFQTGETYEIKGSFPPIIEKY